MKKYFLVDPVRYELLVNNLNAQTSSNSKDKIFNHPNVQKTKEIDKEIDKILHNESLSDYEKNEQFNSKLDDFVSNFRSAITSPKSEALFGKPSSNNPLPSTISPQFLEETLSSIPDSYQPNAKKLISFLKGNDTFSWNEKNELIYKGKVLQGSDVGQLLNDAVRSKKNSSSDDTFQNFLSALKSEGYPVHKLSNQKKKKSAFRVQKPKRKPRLTTDKNVSSILKAWVTSE